MTNARRRIPDYAGHVSAKRLPKGPTGLPLCRWCKVVETAGPRNTFCSKECVHEHQLTTNPSYQAKHVLERDKGVCESCGRDCVALLAELRRLRYESRKKIFSRLFGTHWGAGRACDQVLRENTLLNTGPEYVARCDELELPRHFRLLHRRLWEMDHRIPVVEGGGSCGLDNLRTLCWACHRRETKALAARRAEARKRRKEAP